MSTREQLSTTVNKKFYDILRRHAYSMRLNQNDVLELYQNAYLEKVEKEKAKKKAEREGKNCKSCGQLIIN
jgi:hypothetical protein